MGTVVAMAQSVPRESFMSLKADGSIILVKTISFIYVSVIDKSLWPYLLMTPRFKVHVL